MRLGSIYGLISRSKTLVSLVVAIAVVLMNMVFVQSMWVGIVAIVAYFLVMGVCLSRAFFGDEQEAFTRLVFGTFLSISFCIFTGLIVNMVYQLDFLSLTSMLAAPLLLLAVRALWRRLLHSGRKEEVTRSETVENVPVFSPLFVVPVALIVYCFYLLAEARSGWVNGNVWTVVSPLFFYVYFLVALSLFLVIFICKTRVGSKLFLIMLFSVLSALVWAIVLYPGNSGDPLGHLGFANMIYSYGSWRPGGLNPVFLFYWLLKGKALAVFTASVAKLSVMDVFWVHTFGAPILWGVFVPLTAYKIGRLISGEEKISILAALMSAFYGFVSWGARSSAMGLGLIIFFVSLYFSLRHLKSGMGRTYLWLALFTAIVSGVAHPLTGIMAFVSLFLAVSFRRWEAMKLERPHVARFLLVSSFLISALLLPMIFFVNGWLYIYFSPPVLRDAYIAGATAFSLEKLRKADLWSWVFGDYVSLDFKGVLHSVVVPFLGLVGMAYVLKKGDKKSRVLALVTFAAFLIFVVDNRILQYAMVNTPFGASRVLVFQDFVTIPFAALTIGLCASTLIGGAFGNPRGVVSALGSLWVKPSAKQFFAMVLVGLSLSAFAVSSIERDYGWLGGLQPTELEVEAVKYIDEHTTGKYIVIAMPTTAAIGSGFVGMWNPDKWYVYEKGNYYLASRPSVSTIYDYMKMYDAGMGYYIASSFRTPNYDEAVKEASRIFGLFGILNNEHGEIRIFQYKVAPLPVGPEVMAFWWSSPAAYFIQNDKLRIIINPETKTLEVVDFWGDIYEVLDLNRTLLDGEGLGDLMSVEYYDPLGDIWNVWERGEDILESPALATQFKFRINLVNGSLVGVLEEGNPSIEFWWQNGHSSTLSLQTGDFSRLYIPGLLSGRESYTVTERDFGMFYTLSRTDNVVLRPAYKSEIEGSSLNFWQVKSYCNFTITTGYYWYDFYIENKAEMDQWAYVEMWLPDVTYGKTYPPLSYSLDDGKTWTPLGSIMSNRDPIRTVSGLDVNWVMAGGSINEKPKAGLYTHPLTKGAGGQFELPESFTDSGGGQKRMLFGVFLPGGDKVLVRLGASIYYSRPLRLTYLFKDSDNVDYGLRNMKEPLIAFYKYGASEYVGGLSLADAPSSLEITQDEDGKIKSVVVQIPSGTVFSLLSMKNVNTMVDLDQNGVPDSIEALEIGV